MTKPNPLAITFGVVVLLLGALLAYLIGTEGGIMEYTSSARTGHDQGQLLFVLVTRVSLFPLLGSYMIAYGAGLVRTQKVLLVLTGIAAIANGISMVAISF